MGEGGIFRIFLFRIWGGGSFRIWGGGGSFRRINSWYFQDKIGEL